MAKFEKQNGKKQEDEKQEDEKWEDETQQTIEMVYPGVLSTDGFEMKIYGFPAVGNKDGLVIVTIPKSKLKNEAKRKENRLVPYDVYLKKQALDKEAEELY